MAAAAGPSPYSPPTGTMPAFDAFAITPHDSNNLAIAARAVYVGGAGNIKLLTLASASVEFIGIPAGTILPVQCIRIFSTSTTASALVALT